MHKGEYILASIFEYRYNSIYIKGVKNFTPLKIVRVIRITLSNSNILKYNTNK
jgi:hypothetical protein